MNDGLAMDELLAERLKALGHPARLQILRVLAARGTCVCGEVVRVMPLSQATVSQHLKVLKDAGLVVDRPAGARRIYQLDPDGVGALRAYLDRFWTSALAAYKTAVEQRPEEVS
jgi:DNA-binding transcriptional ArsR family regulator